MASKETILIIDDNPENLRVLSDILKKKDFEKTITREKITVYNVPYYGMLDEKTGYIRLSNFTTKAGKSNLAANAKERSRLFCALNKANT